KTGSANFPQLVSFWKLLHGTVHDSIENQLVGAAWLPPELRTKGKQHNLSIALGHAHHGRLARDILIFAHGPPAHQQTGIRVAGHYIHRRFRGISDIFGTALALFALLLNLKGKAVAKGG